jgi:hypothetical protein
MIDLIFVAASVLFFILAAMYARGCEGLKGGRGNA